MVLVTVTPKIPLTNNLSTVYATKFSLDVGLTDVTNITVRDSAGQIAPQVTQSSGGTHIGFNFLDAVAGKNKVNNFSISYQTRDIVGRNGSVWEINIPRLDGTYGSSTYDVTISVPPEFGQPAFISPAPDSQTAMPAGVNTYHYLPHLGYQPPVSAVFGLTQFMEFQLTYHLENTQPIDSTMSIALPPDTVYQQVAYKQLEPRPKQVWRDSDGNWLADYRLSPRQLLTIQVLGDVRINFKPESQPETDEALAEYLESTEYWQVDADEIKTLAGKLKTPKAIYQYVVDNLSYSYDKVNQGGGRLGAVEALKTPELSICTEFTDLFIALARSAGIPARELEGFAFTSNDRLRPLSLNQDILHAWPEYYDRDKQTWVQIDPTWGKTTGGIDYFSKLDLNHFVFVIHGTDPTKPSPAGAYKIKTDPKKDVTVTAIGRLNWPKYDLAISLADSSTPTQPAIVVRNVGPIAASGKLELKSEPPGIIDEQIELQDLPPFGFSVFKLSPHLPWSLRPINFSLKINDGQRNVSLGTSAQKPIPTTTKISLGAGLGLLAATAFYSRRLHFRRREWQEPLHW